MKTFLLLLFTAFTSITIFAQEDIVLDLDSIKNIKTTRYSSINEIGVNISVAVKVINKFPDNTVKEKLEAEKPSMLFRTVHGALLNPHIFVGAGVGIDFRPNNNYGIKYYNFTFPFFAELRQYILSGNFNVFFSERLGGSVYVDSYLNQNNNNGSYSGAFGEFMIGGRYVLPNRKFAMHFGVGYRLQHLQRKIDFSGSGSQFYTNIPEITIKHYVPVSVGITF